MTQAAIKARRIVYLLSVFALSVFFVLGLISTVWHEGRLPDILLRHLREIEMLMQQQDYPTAVRRLQVATAIARDDDRALYLLGVALREAGDSNRARRALLQTVKLNPRHLDAHYLLGLMCLQENELESAIQHNRIVLRFRPANESALNNLGLALMRLGRHREAAQCFRRALEVHPGFGPAEQNLELMRSGQLLSEA